MRISASYAHAVAKTIAPVLADLPAAYKWRMPREVPAGVKLPESPSSVENVRSLKRQLNAVWTSSAKDDRIALANWYVRTWGGVKRLDPVKLAEFVAEGTALADRTKWENVASWSKVLNLHDPARYPIFDARVSASLNAITLASTDPSYPIAPILPSRNTQVKRFYNKYRKVIRDRSFNLLTYRGYVELLAVVAQQFKAGDIESVEMALFAFADPANGPSRLHKG